MEKIFVQWMFGQFLVAKVTYHKKHFVEFEVLYPFSVIKGDFFSEDVDFTNEENCWIIKNFINRVVFIHLQIATGQRIWKTEIQDPNWFTNGATRRQLVELVHQEKHHWWEEDYIKFFSKKTIENMMTRINHCLQNPTQNFIAEDFEMEREKTINKMKSIILKQKVKEVYIYLCDRRFDRELKNFHKKLEFKRGADPDYELALALTESSYSYPDVCLTTHSDLLRKEFEKKPMAEKLSFYNERTDREYWNPYFDLAKEWLQNNKRIKEFNVLQDTIKVNLYNQMINGKNTGYNDLLQQWWLNRY